MLDSPVARRTEEIASLRGRGLDVRFTVLWSAGSLEGLRLPCVAIVGTRAASPLGKRLARTMAADLGRSGCCILSGLALGIDAAAHEGALDAGAPTIGILGGGHRRFFPRRNRALAQRMVDGGGAVLSPFAPDHPALPPQFLERNGVVAALADAVVVIEAPQRSGALNTANWAAGRIPVLAVPGDVDRPQVQGCLTLLRDGATLARNAADVLEALGIESAQQTAFPPQTTVALPLPPDARAIIAALASGELGFDEIVERCGLGVAATSAALIRLEVDGAIERRDGTRFARTR